MRVLHIGKYFPPYAGGMETYLRDLVTAQARQGLEPAALVHQSESSMHSQEEEYASGDHAIPVTRAAVWARLLFTPISPTFPWQLQRLIKNQRPDILHFHMPNVSAFWALFLPSTRRIPWVIHWHSDVLASEHSVGLRIFYTLYRPFERALLKRSKAIIATSPPYLESSKPLKDFRQKCQVVPLGLDPANLSCDEPPVKESRPDVLRVLAIGRLTYYKGFESLIRAAAQVENVELHIVGGGDLEHSLQELTAELKAKDKVFFHGKLPDEQLAWQYQACDCLCLPSIERTEAFGMVLLEAMSHGKATIVSKVEGSGMTWIVDHGVTGEHIPPEDATALAISLRNLQGSRGKMQALGKRGRDKFYHLFQIDVSAAGVSNVYRKVKGSTDSGISRVHT